MIFPNHCKFQIAKKILLLSGGAQEGLSSFKFKNLQYQFAILNKSFMAAGYIIF
jgi:hypothetical protein